MAQAITRAQLIHAVSRRLNHAVAEALVPSELTSAQLLVLEALHRLPAPASQIELAADIGVRQPTMASTLSRMQRDGWLTIATDPSDFRRTQIRQTARARRRYGKAVAAKAAAEENVLKDLTDTDREDLDRILSKLD